MVIKELELPPGDDPLILNEDFWAGGDHLDTLRCSGSRKGTILRAFCESPPETLYHYYYPYMGRDRMPRELVFRVLKERITYPLAAMTLLQQQGFTDVQKIDFKYDVSAPNKSFAESECIADWEELHLTEVKEGDRRKRGGTYICVKRLTHGPCPVGEKMIWCVTLFFLPEDQCQGSGF